MEMTPMADEKMPVARISDPMSIGQATRMEGRFATKFYKDGKNLPHELVQQVLEHEGDLLAAEMLYNLRVRVARRRKMFSRPVLVYPRTHREILRQLLDGGYTAEYVNEDIFYTMPGCRQSGCKVDLWFFEFERAASAPEIHKAYEVRNLKPDGAALVQAVIDEPALVADKKVICQWDYTWGSAPQLAISGENSSRWFTVTSQSRHHMLMKCVYAGVPK